MRKKGQKSTSVDMDGELFDMFTKQYLERGFKKYKALEGAMRLWLSLNSAQQSIWIEGKPPIPPDGSDSEIYADLDELARKFAAVSEKIRKSEQARKQRHEPS